MRKSAVIFDLGNVVVDWNFAAVLDSLGLASETRNRLERELFAHADWHALDRGAKTEAEVALEVCARSSLELDLIEQTLDAARHSLTPIDTTVALMHELATTGHRLFCLSNMSRETYAHIRDRAFFDLFDGIVISAHEGCVKPQREIYQRLLQRYDIAPGDAFFIDDLAANVDTARGLGIDAHQFARTLDCYDRIRRSVG